VSRILTDCYGLKAPVALCYRVSWPDEKIIWTTVEKLAETLQDENLDRHTLMLVGPAVETLKTGRPVPKSRLYDTTFTHLFREGKNA
jgi:precorrin-4/cobalt-precorrin-4 C11-methyltransferase